MYLDLEQVTNGEFGLPFQSHELDEQVEHWHITALYSDIIYCFTAILSQIASIPIYDKPA